MIEQIVLSGNKHMYATDVQQAQTETLEPLQRYFKSFGACIIEGCTLVNNGSNWDISSGLVAINHIDGFKVARFAGIINTPLPGYLCITKTTQNGAYDDNPTKVISNTYTAEFTVGTAPNATDLYLPMYSLASNTFADAFSKKAITVWSSYYRTVTQGIFGPILDVDLKYRLNRVSRQLYLLGTIEIRHQAFPSGNDGNVEIGEAGSLLSSHRPAEVRYCTGYADINNTLSNQYRKDVNNVDYMDTAVLRISADGSLNLRLKRSSAASLTLRFNEIIPLD